MDIRAVSRHPNDPDNVNGSKYFVPNWKDMTITVDGHPVDMKEVVRANAVKNTLDILRTDENGNVILESHGNPATVKHQYDDVTISSEIKRCTSCTKNAMKKRRWWLS